MAEQKDNTTPTLDAMGLVDAINRENKWLTDVNRELLDALRAFCGDYEATPTTKDTSLKAAYLNALVVIAKAEGAKP